LSNNLSERSSAGLSYWTRKALKSRRARLNRSLRPWAAANALTLTLLATFGVLGWVWIVVSACLGAAP